MNGRDSGHEGVNPNQWNALHEQAKEFVLERLSNGTLRAKTPFSEWTNTPDAFWILDQFASPQRPREIAERSSRRNASALAWINTMETIRGLIRAGVLVEQGSIPAVQEPVGFAMDSQHILMLNDQSRTLAFLRAIRDLVKPDDVVVDIGTGTGVLALAAGLAGARHVYALERSAMASVAAAGVKTNHLEERITVLQQNSINATLPERARIVVGEIIGDDLFDEGILPTFADAAKRFATSDAVFVPNALQPVLQPLQLPTERLARLVYLPETCRQWTESYGIDFQWLTQASERTALVRHEVRPEKVAEFVCGPEIPLPKITFPNPMSTFNAQVHWPGSSGANAFLLGFRADLGSGNSVSNLAGATTTRGSWAAVLFVSVPTAGPDLAQPQRMTICWQGGQTQVKIEKSV